MKDDMSNLAKDIEAAANTLGEEIEAVVLGTHDRLKFSQEKKDQAPRQAVLSWADARQWLDEDYDSGFGGADCRPFYAWTKSWVLWVSEYDGATSLALIPRNPVAIEPDFSGASLSLMELRKRA